MRCCQSQEVRFLHDLLAFSVCTTVAPRSYCPSTVTQVDELSAGTGLYTGASGYYQEISLTSDSNAKTPGQAING